MWQSFRAIGRGNSENEWRKYKKNYMDIAKPDVRPPGAAIPSAKSISVAEIPLAATAVGLQPYSER